MAGVLAFLGTTSSSWLESVFWVFDLFFFLFGGLLFVADTSKRFSKEFSPSNLFFGVREEEDPDWRLWSVEDRSINFLKGSGNLCLIRLDRFFLSGFLSLDSLELELKPDMFPSKFKP